MASTFVVKRGKTIAKRRKTDLETINSEIAETPPAAD
jgi:hypothetical protein